MILNNLFYITAKVSWKSCHTILHASIVFYMKIKRRTQIAFFPSNYFAIFIFFVILQFSDTHPRDIEELWGTLCQFWPNNLKVILRYLVIMSGMAPNELLSYVSRRYLIADHLNTTHTAIPSVSPFVCPLVRQTDSQSVRQSVSRVKT